MAKIPREQWDQSRRNLDRMYKLLEERVKVDERIAREKAEREAAQQQES
jgi:hypothetical protein